MFPGSPDPKFPWKSVFWLYLFLLVLVYGTSNNEVDADLWHQFPLVDYLCHTGHFPKGDTFSYLADYQEVPDHEWGSGFIFYPAYFWGGGVCLIALKLAALAATLALVVRAGLGDRSPTILEAFFYSLVLLALLSCFLSTLRCEVFTHLFFALWVLWFQRERRGDKIPVAWYVGTMVVWVNLHGGFALGLMWLALLTGLEFCTGGPWKRRAVLLALCLLATLINPFGPELGVGVVRALLVARPGFAEWAPVPWIENYETFSGYKILLLWMIAVLIGHLRREGWKKGDRVAILLFAFFTVVSLLQARQTSVFAIVVGGLLPPLFPPEPALAEIRERKLWWSRFLTRALLFLLPLALAVRLLPTNKGFRLVYPPDTCPVQAVDYLHLAGLTGRLLVDFNSSSYALWELRGRMRVSIDGRYDLVYRPETF